MHEVLNTFNQSFQLLPIVTVQHVFSGNSPPDADVFAG